MKKIQRELVGVADEYGFDLLGTTHGNHFKFRHRRTGGIVFHSTTPSDTKAINALRAQFNKINLDRVPTDRGQRHRRGNRGRRKMTPKVVMKARVTCPYCHKENVVVKIMPRASGSGVDTALNYHTGLYVDPAKAAKLNRGERCNGVGKPVENRDLPPMSQWEPWR